jgi:hypothetical protein
MARGAVALRPKRRSPKPMRSAYPFGLIVLSLSNLVFAQSRPAVDPGPVLRAELRLEKGVLQTGQPVWAELSLTNLSDNSLPLQVPEAEAGVSPPGEMGLPLAHVFSGRGFRGIDISDSHGEIMEDRVTRTPRGPVPVVQLAAHASVGVRLDLARHYDALAHRPGKYTLVWRPYGGTVESEPVTVQLLAEQQAVMLTDYGRLVMRFYYDQAPRHVQNFVELIGQRFYDNLTFHRIVAGAIIQGGGRPSSAGFRSRRGRLVWHDRRAIRTRPVVSSSSV